MAENMALNPSLEGVSILTSDADSKTYVINEVLNYYQRKLSVCSYNQMLALAHHQFERARLAEAKQILLKLWAWRRCNPSVPEKEYIINNLKERRKTHKCPALAKDIIEFLQVEDRNLDIVFLSLRCEDLPCKVSESAAMQDVYVLLHERENENMFTNDKLTQQSDLLELYAQKLNEMQSQMHEAFKSLSDKVASIQGQQAPIDCIASGGGQSVDIYYSLLT